MRRSRNKVKDIDIDETLGDFDIQPVQKLFIKKVISNTSYFIDLLEDRREKRLDRKLSKDIKKLESALEIIQDIRFESVDHTNQMEKVNDGLKYMIDSLQYIDDNRKDIQPESLVDFTATIRTVKSYPQKNDILKAAALHIALILEDQKSTLFLKVDDLRKNEAANEIIAKLFLNEKSSFSMSNLKWLSFHYRHDETHSIGILPSTPQTVSGYSWISNHTFMDICEEFGNQYPGFDFEDII